MMKAFDPDGSYLSPAGYAKLLVDVTTASVGLELIVRDGALLVIAPIPGGPAARARIAPRDRLLAIDGWTVDVSDLGGVFPRLGGQPGSSVAVTVQSGNFPPRVLTLEREVISFRSVWSTESKRTSDGYGFVRLRALSSGASAELSAELTRLEPLRGLVLDLRFNSGGLLNEGLSIVELLLASGPIARLDARGTASDRNYSAGDRARWSTIPIVVLVNQETASGAELIAAALQQNGRATTMGTHTLGRGIVHTLFPLGEDRALRLTTSQLFTPRGAPLAKGLDPDIAASGTLEVFDIGTDADTIVAKAMDVLRSSAGATIGAAAATPAPPRP